MNNTSLCGTVSVKSLFFKKIDFLMKDVEKVEMTTEVYVVITTLWDCTGYDTGQQVPRVRVFSSLDKANKYTKSLMKASDYKEVIDGKELIDEDVISTQESEDDNLIITITKTSY